MAGAGLSGEGYPNARNTIQALSQINGLDVIDYSAWLPENIKLWELATNSKISKIGNIAKILVSNLSSVTRLLCFSPRRSIVYVPYPGIITLWSISWLPKAIRPRCISDSYITLWDSLYKDRKLANEASLFCRALLAFESRALRAAEVVITDTEANAEHVSTTFKIRRDRIHSMPLALVPHAAQPPGPEIKATTRTNVLFIGTFVPLQGTEIIARAIHLLRKDSSIKFVLIGDGQDAERAEPWLAESSSVTWIRTWQSRSELEAHIANANICLGIFGGPGKAERVLPFKNYLALRAGKAIITQDKLGLPKDAPKPPMVYCSEDPQSLADAIRALASAPTEIRRIERAASKYYQEYLSDAALARHWKQLLSTLSRGNDPLE